MAFRCPNTIFKHISILYFFSFKIGGGGGWSLFQNNPKNLDPSYRMDLDFLIVLEGRDPSCSKIIQV